MTMASKRYTYISLVYSPLSCHVILPWLISRHPSRGLTLSLCTKTHNTLRARSPFQVARTPSGIVVFQQWRRQGYRRFRPTPPASRTQLRSTSWPGPLWTCVWKRIYARGQGSRSGGGRRRYYTWRWRGRLLGRRNGRIGRGGNTGRRRRWINRWEDIVATIISYGQSLMLP